jgi:hypothetical protein
MSWSAIDAKLTIMTNPSTATPRATKAIILGQVIGALGIGIQWVGAPEIFGGFPPGILFIAAAAAIVWVDRRSAWSPLAAVLLSFWIAVGGLASGKLGDNLASSNVVLVAGNVVMLLGLLFSAVAGVFAIRHNRRARQGAQVKPLSADNPHRVAVLVMVAGLLADAIGDAAPEGLDWDGPGPAVFFGLAVMVALIPGRFAITLSAILSAAFVYGALTNPEPLEKLSTPSDLLGFAGILLQLLGLVVAVVAGLVAISPARSRAGGGVQATAR